jgi:hypothetical protein
MELKATENNISTSVISVNTNSIIDIENVFKHIILNNVILGSKFNNNYRGKFYEKKKTGTIFNQVTIPVYIKSILKEVNIKVFNNGKLQITGVKNIFQAEKAVDILIDNIKDLNGFNDINILYHNNIFYNKDEYLLFNDKPKERFNSVKFYDIVKKIQIGEKKGYDIILFFPERTSVIEYPRNPNFFIERGNSKETDRI